MKGFCPDSEWFSAYAERRLDEKDEIWLRRHASRCDDCRREMALVCQQVGREAADCVPAEVQARVRNAIVRLTERSRLTRRVRSRRTEKVHYAVFAAAILMIVFGLSFVLVEQAQRPDIPQNPVVKEEPKKTPEFRKIPPREWPPILPEEEKYVVRPEEEEFRLPDPPPKPEEERPDIARPDREPEFRPEDIEKPRNPRETKAWGRVVAKHSPLMITDPVGELALRRMGEKDVEQVTGRVAVNSGDVLLAHGPSSFYIEGEHGVVLDADTELSISNAEVKTEAGSWFTVFKGRVIVHSRGREWWLANGVRTVNVDKTRSLFAVSTGEGELAVTPLDRDLDCENENGEKISVKCGQEAKFDQKGCRTGSVSTADRRTLAMKYRYSRPQERTMLYTPFDYTARETDEVSVLEGHHSRAREGRTFNYFLKAVEVKRTARIKLEFREDKIPLGSNEVIRFRYRTNAALIRIMAPVEGKPASLLYQMETDPKARTRWVTAEIPSTQFSLVWEAAGKVQLGTDCYASLSLEVTRKDVSGTAPPFLLIDDLQILLKQD